MKVSFALGCVPALAGLLAGCQTTTVIDEYHSAPTALSRDEAIVVLGRRHAVTHETEHDFIACVGERIGEGGAVAVIAEPEFKDAMYPWFEPATAPMNVAALQKMLAQPKVARRVAELGVRYVVWVDGSTERTESTGNISCTVGPGGGGCFGYASWSDEADYEASIWDLAQASVSGLVSTHSEGTSHMPAVFVPIPLLARVQGSACESMATQLAGRIQVVDDTAAVADSEARSDEDLCVPETC